MNCANLAVSANGAFNAQPRPDTCPLSPRERVRVRGNGTQPYTFMQFTLPDPMTPSDLTHFARQPRRNTWAEVQKDVCFPLTPALSLGERENRVPLWEQAGAPARFDGLPAKSPTSGVRQRSVQRATSPRHLFPLPKGEG
jgi:hypothetical protein